MKEKKLKMRQRKEIESNTDSFAIDINKLDTEWERQPRFYSEIADKLADAKRDLADAEAELEEAKAEIANNIRKNPADYDAEKVTEGVVKELVPLQPAYRRALDKYNDAKYVVDRLAGDIKAADHRKYALQDLVELRLADYFSEPKARSVGSRKAMEEAGKLVVRKRLQTRHDDEDE